MSVCKRIMTGNYGEYRVLEVIRRRKPFLFICVDTSETAITNQGQPYYTVLYQTEEGWMDVVPAFLDNLEGEVIMDYLCEIEGDIAAEFVSWKFDDNPDRMVPTEVSKWVLNKLNEVRVCWRRGGGGSRQPRQPR